MAVVKLKKIKLHGSGAMGTWPPNANVQICFAVVPIGSGITPGVNSWKNFPNNTQLTFLANGYLSMFVDGQYGGADLMPPLMTNSPENNAQVDIHCGYGTASVKFDVIT